ncbi:MAG: hypothetical protein DIU84_04635 [Bacillota bacterium]|nr:MAG: hypothetical protein DIU84_04635 [Bacillota bacterium]
MVTRRAVLAAALVVAAAVLLWRLPASPPGRGGQGGAGEPAEVPLLWAELPLLWIEEINNRLLPPGQAAVPGGADGTKPDPGGGAPAVVDEARRVLRLDAAALTPRGAAPALLVRYGVYDHDRLVREAFTPVAEFPLPVVPPPAAGDSSARLLPRSLAITGVDPAGGVDLELDGRVLRLEEGQAWASARVAQGGGVVEVDAGEWSRHLSAALDEDRPVTVLRLLHHGRWRVEASGGEGL